MPLIVPEDKLFNSKFPSPKSPILEKVKELFDKLNSSDSFDVLVAEEDIQKLVSHRVGVYRKELYKYVSSGTLIQKIVARGLLRQKL